MEAKIRVAGDSCTGQSSPPLSMTIVERNGEVPIRARNAEVDLIAGRTMVVSPRRWFIALVGGVEANQRLL